MLSGPVDLQEVRVIPRTKVYFDVMEAGLTVRKSSETEREL